MEQLGQEDPQSGQRMLWAMLLMGIVFIGWQLFMGPGKKQQQKSSAPPATQAATESPKAARSAKKAALPSEAAIVAAPVVKKAVIAKKERIVILENDVLKLSLSNRGGVLIHAQLKKYKDNDGAMDDLVSPLAKLLNRYPLALQTRDLAYNKKTAHALFHVERSDKDGRVSLSMKWSDGKGNSVSKTLTLPKSGYILDLRVSAVKGGKTLRPVPLAWGPGFAKLLASEASNHYYQKGYVGLDEAGSFKKVTRSKVNDANPRVVDTYGETGPIKWAAITDNYFASIFIPSKVMPWVHVITLKLSKAEHKVQPGSSCISLVVPYPGNGKLYIGPKEYGRFRKMGSHFTRLMGWGGSIIGPVLTPIGGVLLWSLTWLNRYCNNWGIAILLLTLIIKLIFYPLTQKSMVKMKSMGDAMKKLKPQVDRLKAKYKKIGKDMASRSKMNEEMMALYKREGVNPLGSLGGCLPMLIQMPIFFALFELLPRAIELRGAYFFGWIKDLSVQDPYYITPVLMGISMIFSTKMTQTQTVDGGGGTAKMMIWFMPIMFTWFCLWAPAGLTLYWLGNNVLTIGQQALINKEVAKKTAEMAKSKKSTPKKQSRPSHG